MKTNVEKIQKPSGLPNSVIPLKVLFDEKLTLREKVLFGILNSLSNEQGYYIACNEWLGLLLGVSAQTVSNALSKLSKHKYITLKIDKTPETGKTRKIFINSEYLNN